VVPHVVDLRLTKLRLNRITGGPFIEAFAHRLSHLRVLSLDGCMFPTAELLTTMVEHLNGRILTSICLVGCRTLEDIHVNSILAKCSVLTSLLLPDCTRLRQPNLIHNLLEEINFSKCTSIESFPQVRLPQVRVLLLEWCRNLSVKSIEKVVSTLPMLTRLEMGGSVAIHKLNLSRGLSLRTLRLGMCESLQTLRVENCSQLSDLQLGLCVGLRRLEIYNCPSLTDLDASLLSKLESVHVERCAAMQFVNVTTTTDAVSVTVVPTTLQVEQTKVIDECARLAEGDGPGSTGSGTGMKTTSSS
jgi:hypothetical protein